MTASSTTSAPAPLRTVPFVGSRVREWRHELGLTAEEFAALVRQRGRQLSASGLTAIEREDNGPLPGTARAIADVLGRKVRDFHPDVTPEEVRP